MEKDKDISNIMMDYFSSFLSSNGILNVDNQDLLLSSIPSLLDEDSNNFLVDVPISKEIEKSGLLF